MAVETSARTSPRLLLGLFLMAMGVVFTLDNLGVLDAEKFLPFWPAVVIAIGLQKLADPRGRGAGLIWIVIGAWLLLNKLGWLRFHFWDLWPLVFVALGASVISRGAGLRGRGSVAPLGSRTVLSDSDSTVTAVAVMGGWQRTNNSQDFRGGELSAIMGGCILDLRQAAMAEPEATIDVLAFLGGVEIKVPEDWSVTMKGLPIMGGFEDATTPPKGGSSQRLLVKGLAIMGGIKVRN